MSLVTSGAETWTAHSHRHHAGGTAWIFGPEGPSESMGPYPITAMAQIGDAYFLFWNAAGAEGGGRAYPAGDLAPSPPPSFPAGTDSGSLIAWYQVRGGNGPGRPGLIFDALLETAGNWIDWDATNDPFTVTEGERGPQPDSDDEVYTDGGPGVVNAQQFFPGTDYFFDQWLVFGGDTHLAPTDRWQVSQDEGTSGTAFAIYRRPGDPRIHRPPVEGPLRWFDMGDPAPRIRSILSEQSELSQIASLLDFSSVISDQEARVMLQRGMYEALITAAQNELDGLKGRVGEPAPK